MDQPTPNPSPRLGRFAYPEMFANPSPWTLAPAPRPPWPTPAVRAVLADADLTLTVTRFDL